MRNVFLLNSCLFAIIFSSYAAVAPGIALSPATAALRPGTTQTFTPRLTGGVVATNLIWQVSPALGTIDQSGKYTAPASAPGSPITVTVKAYDKTQTAVAGTAAVNLLNPTPSISSLTPTSINQNLAYSISLKGGGFLRTSQVMWDGKVVQSQYVSDTELALTGTTALPGGTSIAVTVVNPDPGSKTSSARTLTVQAPVQVTLTPDNKTVRCGASMTLYVHVVNSSNQGITWTSKYGSIDANNVYSAPAVLPAGTDDIITASAKVDATAKASITIHLANPAPVISSVNPAKVSIGPLSLTINGTGFARNASVFFAGTALNITWVSDKALTATGQTAAVLGGLASLKVMNPEPGTLVSAPVQVPVSQAQPKLAYGDAVRLLEQASWGPTPAAVAHLQEVGIPTWLFEQFSMPATPFPDPVDDKEGVSRLKLAFFTHALTGADQLRQRVAFALSEVFVVSATKDSKFALMVPYVRLLSEGAFGSFRDLMTNMTLNAGMGYFLDMVNNDVANARKNTVANENYARELMQLFTLGLTALNVDGTTNGALNYDQATVTDMAKVMTGWTYPAAPGVASRWTNPAYYIGPMTAIEDHHDKTQKVLNFPKPCTIAAGGTAESDLKAALDCIYSQDSVAPFISYRLIQHLVMSNPSPAYVAHVAGVFKSTNGNLKAVVTDILTQPEALTANSGKLREPVLFATSLLRSLNATVNGDASGINNQTTAMSQDVLAAPSVFNYFSPFYRVNGTPAPEFQILNAATSLARINFAYRVVNNQLSSNVRVDLSNLYDLASDPKNLNPLLDAINQALYRGQMSAQEKSAILAATTGLTSSSSIVRNALYVAAAAPQYQVQH